MHYANWGILSILNATSQRMTHSSPLSLFSLDAAITEAKREADGTHRRADVVVDVPAANPSLVATTNDKNAPPNEGRTVNNLHGDGPPPPGKPCSGSLVGTETTRVPSPVAVAAAVSA